MKLPQLTLRELFLLVVIAAMGCGWWVDRTALATTLKSHAADLQELRAQAQSVTVNVDGKNIELMRGKRMIIEAEAGTQAISIHYEPLAH